MNLLSQVSQKLFTARTLAETGILRPTRPDKALRIANAVRRWGPTPAAGYTASTIRDPDGTAIVDELGTLTFEEVHRRTNALAHSLSDAGVKEGDGVAIMIRNHRGFVDATVACSKLGAHALYLNTAFAGPQITEVVQREKPVALIYDAEFEGLTHDAGERRKRFIAWHDGGEKPKDPLLEDLIEAGDPADVVAPENKGRVVILTSGTTGSPKGAQRKQPDSLDPAAALFSKIPLRAGEPTMIAAPMFHSWGFVHFTLGMGLGSTLVLRRKFDPEDTLSATAQHECTVLVVVPVMLSRILELPAETIDMYDLGALRVIAASGSALPGELAVKVMDRFGDVLYNLYGSTEVAWATIATPEDLRAAPGTAGRPPRGTVVKLIDEAGNEVPAGDTGRIFVGNEMAFEGYTGGGSKENLGGLLSSGDVGHFDSGGRLFIDGRDDEMIVSGGENVFPREVEDLLHEHEAVDEVAVIGVDDEQFGQRLKAFVVVSRGAKVDADELKDLVKANLARYKVPRDVEFLDELPRNATGKVLKRELAERESMLVEHEGRSPQVDPEAWVAPTAVLCGDVRVAAGARVLWNAVLVDDGGPVELGEQAIVMEQALLRGRADQPVRVGAHVIVGPHAHLNGVDVGEGAFIATGAALFPGARIGAGAEVRINGVVHVNSVLAEGGLVPIGWVAVGDPAQVLPPDRHDDIWAVQRELDFPGTVLGIERGGGAAEATRRYAELFGRHRDDTVIG